MPRPIDPMVLDEMEKKEPGLVAKYRAKMAASDADLAGAEKMQNLAGYSGVAGQLATDFINSQRKDTVLHNRMQDLGKAPTIMKADRYEWDNSIVDRLAADKMDKAQRARGEIGKNMMMEEQFAGMDRQAGDLASLRDPNSEVSRRTREAMKRTMPGVVSGIEGFDNISAEQADRMLPLLKDKWQADREEAWRQKQLSESAAARAHERGLKAGEKRDKYIDEHTTPYGLANTPDDAKKLKQAYEDKANFDRKLDELIALRKKYGGEVWDREAVARGKQLSKDLLLTYKNMAKLGVLSQADEDIINAIIPPDPLEFRPTDGTQDSILHTMQKFRQDSDADFKNRIETRIKVPSEKAKSFDQPSTVRVKNDETGEMLEISRDDLEAAKKDGFKEF